ncbi:hypothetical protein MACH09_31250 [Vibrio sp. MACH09]|uniref:N-acetylneuraminate anomerase n=1 Tax=Vibrio sp. MACH09 TaxID=3025122 RepID=UPI002793B46A|nr:N-acetylneuraminate anomerase [Vibrio sp. MACH09]GLO62617.1 hypothetical protein MACH09_31250 [Vibrio sp. MACH09]
MLLCHINQIEHYHYLPEAIRQGLQYIASIDDHENVAIGRHDIKGDLMFAVVMEYTTEAAADKQAELHQQYIDIQTLLSGTETIEYGLPNADNTPATDYDEKSDFQLLSNVANPQRITLRTGDCALFFPTEPHKPGCSAETQINVKKMVVKIHHSLLK